MVEKSELKALLLSSFDETIINNCTIEGDNPFYVKIGGAEYYIYIKNITPTAFPNENLNVSRIQLPRRSVFDAIIESDIYFILLGYDSENDVYTTWNPYWSKQRLNRTCNVSFYSREDAQKQAKEEQGFATRELNNDGIVVAFPRKKLLSYLTNINEFFPVKNDYVAIGSKLRTEANETFKFFNHKDRLSGFHEYLLAQGFALCGAVSNHYKTIKYLIENNYFGHNKKLFIIYDSIDDYPKSIEPFSKLEEINELNIKWHNGVTVALQHYIRYVQQCMNNEVTVNSVSINDSEPINDENYEYHSINNEPINEEKSVHMNVDDNTAEMFDINWYIDWDKSCTDADGKLLHIKNPELLEIIKPFYIDRANPDLNKALNRVMQFYSQRNQYKHMALADWLTAIKTIKFAGKNNPEGLEKIRVIFPNRKGVQYSNVKQTLCEFIKYADPEKVYTLHLDRCVITQEEKNNGVYERYENSLIEIKEGWFVFTNSSTDEKFLRINQINDQLKIGAIVEKISDKDRNGLDTFEIRSDCTIDSIRERKREVENKKIIQIKFPDRTTVNHKDINETLSDVIKYAGIPIVEKLRLKIGESLLILDHETEGYKPLKFGWYILKDSEIESIISCIREVSDKLKLGLIVDIVESNN